MNPRQPTADWVAIRGQRIVAVGRAGEEEAGVAGPGTRWRDCEGKTLVPGFNDAHCHILAYVQSLLSLDCGGANSIAEIVSRIRQRSQEVPPGGWIYAYNYDESRLAEQRHPTRRDLDQAAPQHPVRLLHRTGHALVLNSLGLAALGITIETSEPPGGLMDREVETGEPSGLFFGMSRFIGDRLPRLTETELEAGLRLANESYLSVGITSLQDASASNNPSQWQFFRRLKEAGRLVPRVRVMLGVEFLPEITALGLRPDDGDEHCRLGGIKVVLEETTGRLYPPAEEVNRLVLEAHRAGFAVAIHALEAGALAAALAALPPRKAGLSPHRIEHCALCPPELVEKLQGTGVAVVTQPAFIYYNGDKYLKEIPASQFPDLYRLRSLKEAGLMVAGSSDAPVVPPHPLMGLYAAVTRRTQSGQVIAIQEGISVAMALEMFTWAAAQAAGEGGEKGTIQPGKLADLALLSADPTRCEPDAIREIRVETTMLGGREVWEA